MSLPPDPMSPEARAILEAPPYPPTPGPLTAELAQALRAAQAATRAPVVAEAATRLGIVPEREVVAGVPVVRLAPLPTTQAPPLAGRAFYLHGGGFIGGTALDMTSVLMTEALGIEVVSIDYALAPEAAFPVALDQATAVYTALTSGDPAPAVLFGVSAGANLVLGLAHRIATARRPPPRALGLFSPWADLTGGGDSRESNAGRDPVLRHSAELPAGAAAYAGARPLDDPLVSPIHWPAFDRSFPPSIITTGTRDLFLSDCTRLYWALRRSGATAELRVWENLWHAFNTQPGVPEAVEARAEVAGFLRAALEAV